MKKHFTEEHVKEAFQIWNILVREAKKKEVITYKCLGDEIGKYHRHLRRPLDIIMHYCREHDEDLNGADFATLVIDKSKKRPSNEKDWPDGLPDFQKEWGKNFVLVSEREIKNPGINKFKEVAQRLNSLDDPG